MNVLRCFAVCSIAAACLAQDTTDLNVIHKIKNEALAKGKVGDHLQTLTDRYGPRLTASPEYDASAEWIMARAREWGLSNIHTEKWGPFGRAWSLKRFSVHMTRPQYSPLVGIPLAWSDSTNGVVAGEAMMLPVRESDMEKFEADIARIRKEQAGKLKGKIVLTTSMRQLALQLQPPAKRYTDAELNERFQAPDPQMAKTFDYSRLALPEDETRARRIHAQRTARVSRSIER